MKEPRVAWTMSITALSAAVLITGCCGPNRDRTATYYSPGSTTTEYSATTTTTDTSDLAASQSTETERSAETRARIDDTDRTQVRETTGAGQNEYSLPLYSESLRVGKREVENGSVKLRKTVRTENASQPIELRRETVVIDREAFDQARRASDAGQANEFGMAFQEKEITIDLKREEPVVEVQQFISGRIVAQKKATTEQQNVARQVRHEEVEIVKNGNDRDIQVSERVRARTDAVGGVGTQRDRQTGTSSEDADRAVPRNESEPPRQQR